MALLMNKAHEWLEADGLGGFASGTSLGVRTRRYHALLLASASPPTERFALVNGVDSWIQDGSERHALTRHRYKGETPVAPSAEQRFEPAPWPRWTTRLPSGGEIVHELFVPKGAPAAVLTWRLLPSHASSPVRLRVRPLMSGRDYHALHHVNPRFDFVPTRLGSVLRWQVYTGVPAVMAASNGAYEHAPDWYYRFYYEQEHERGFDALEDLASPGVFEFDLTKGEAVLILAADTPGLPADLATCEPSEWMRRARVAEHTRRSVLGGSLERAADAYIVKRDNAATIIAGYPWFADWGRDTFIALRGLCIATGRLVEARSILLRWAGEVSEGMLPNRFPDDGGEPEFNSVDASLWFVIAAHELIEAADACPGVLNAEDRRTLLRAVGLNVVLARPDWNAALAVVGLACSSEPKSTGLSTASNPTSTKPAVAIAGGGAPLGPRFIWWNLVSTSKARIDEAKRDWTQSAAAGFRDSPFALPPGEEEFIPLPQD